MLAARRAGSRPGSVGVRVVSLLALTLLAGCASRPEIPLGAAISSAAVPVAIRTLLASKPIGSVVLRGTLVEKCPVSGCWFRLKDDTGVVKVDLKSAGVTSTDIPVGTRLSVAGTRQVEGGETSLCATGLRY